MKTEVKKNSASGCDEFIKLEFFAIVVKLIFNYPT